MRSARARTIESEFMVMLHSLAKGRVTTIKDEKHLLGVAGSDNIRNAQYCTNRDRTIHCMIDGDVFVDKDDQQSIARNSGMRGVTHPHFFVPFLYERSGVDFVKMLKGWFNIVIYDSRHKVYHLLNSRLGMRPLYYYRGSGYFIFASRLGPMLKLSLIKRRINKKSVADYALFNYPLGDGTYIEGVSALSPATVMTIGDSGFTQRNYWSPLSLFTKELVSADDSIAQTERLLKKAVNKMHAGMSSVGVSLTGGFDGRTVLSLIDRPKEDLVLYSFGEPGSKDISIPLAISRQLSYEYVPVCLDDDYGNNIFTEYAKECIIRSDCRSTLARAHYLYALDLMSQRVGVVLTGNCGSELIRPVHMTGEVINPNAKIFFKLLENGNISTTFDQFVIPRYFKIEEILLVKDRVCEALAGNALSGEPLTLNQKFYHFLIKEVFRKYFGTEMAMEDGYVHNRSPYLDDDFIDFIFQTPLCGANYNFFEDNPLVRINGQLLYARIINNNNASLARFRTNRMYAPHDLLTNTGRIKAGFSFLYRKLLRNNGEGYGLDLGVERFVQENLKGLDDVEFLNTEEILGDFRDGTWKKHKLDFHKAISWAYWYKNTIRL
ncbi:MAG: hypothetical protein JSV98_10610 [candidate division WOR-3 bacterium]|nr:MAG: hypothetical protein JSV98_10610 [candidate division WOR-3 bacterium]